MTNNRQQDNDIRDNQNQQSNNQQNKEQEDVASFSDSRRAEETDTAPQRYNDDFAVEQEDEISEQEAKTEKNERIGRR